MASAADRFSRLEKLAIFLIALGEERTREILADVDVDTLQHLNGAIAGLGALSAEEKAAVMLEFAHFFTPMNPSAIPGACRHYRRRPVIRRRRAARFRAASSRAPSDPGGVRLRASWICQARSRPSATRNRPSC